VRAVFTEIIADFAVGDVVLVIHWKGDQHSELRVKKPKSGEHDCRASEQALAVMRTMAGRWSDPDIAVSLNRKGCRPARARPGRCTVSGLYAG